MPSFRVVRRISSLKNVSERFRIDLTKVDDLRISMADEFNGFFIDGMNIKIEPATSTVGRKKVKNNRFEETIQFYQNVKSMQLIRKPLDSQVDVTLHMLINLKKLEISDMAWSRNYSRASWIMPNLEHLIITNVDHRIILLVNQIIFFTILRRILILLFTNYTDLFKT